MTNSIDILKPEQKQKAIKAIIDYFATERDEELGVIAAEEFLDMFLDLVGNDVYNKALDDFNLQFKNRLEDIFVDLDTTLRK